MGPEIINDGWCSSYSSMLAQRRRILKVTLVTLLGWLMNFQAGAQIAQTHLYQVSDGLPSSFLTDLALGPDGYLWLATYGAGVARFDGATFECFSSRDEMGGLYFRTMVVDKSGTIWTAGDRILASFQRGQWTSTSVPFNIQKLLPFGQNHLLFCTDRGVHIWDPAESQVVATYLVTSNFHAAIELGGELIAVADDGTYVFDGADWRKLSSENQMDFVDLAIDEDDQLWLLSRSGTIFKLVGKNIIKVSEIPVRGAATFMVPSDLGTLYVGTEKDGVYIYEPLQDRWQKMILEEAEFSHASALLFDEWDNTWLATKGHGLIKLNAAQHRWYGSADGLSGSFISKLLAMPTYLKVVYSNGRVDQFFSDGHLNQNPRWMAERRVTALTSTSTGYIGTDQGVLYVADSAVQLIEAPGVINWNINDIYLDSTRVLYVASRQGIFSVIRQAGMLTERDFSVELLYELPSDKLIPTTLGLWVIAKEDLALWQSGSLHFIHAENQSDLVVTDIREHGGVTYISSRDHGLFYVHQEGEDLMLLPCLGQEQLPTLQIQCFEFDARGYLFIGTPRGIFRTRLDRNQAMEPGYLYDETAGLPSLQLTQGSAALGPRGSLFFGTTTGLLEIDPTAWGRSHRKPTLTLQFAELGPHQFYTLAQIEQQPVTIPVSERVVKIGVKCIDLSVPHGIKYQWQLKGLDPNWQDAPPDGVLTFLSLPAGKYTLNLKAINRDGVLSNLVSIPFIMASPFYLQGWFLIILLLSCLFLIYFVHSRRVRNIERLANQRAKDAELQNELLRLEQSALRLQMNPHFIFNALQSIQSKIGQRNTKDARTDLQRFAKLMRNYLDQARHQRITLEDEIESLRQYLQIEQSLKNEAFQFRITWPEEMDPSFYQLPPMLIQPFVENAVKHGLPQREQGKIWVDFQWKGRYLSCVIRDNGDGFAQLNQEKDHDSAGVKVTRDRLRSFFKNTTIDPLSMRNLFDQQGRVRGAEVVLVLPITNED